jgi:hypothetical protein
MSVHGPDNLKAAQHPLGEPYAVRLEEDRWATVRHIVEAIAIVCAGIWAFYTFVYQERIKPAGEPAALNLGVSFLTLSHSPKRDLVKLVIDLHNVGKTEFDLAADGYNVMGERFASRQVPRTDEHGPRYERRTDQPIVSRHLVAAFVELRARAIGGRKGIHIIVEPGATETMAYVIAIPPNAYDLLHAKAMAIPVKTDSTQPIPVKVTRSATSGYSIGTNAPGVSEDDNEADFAPPQ